MMAADPAITTTTAWIGFDLAKRGFVAALDLPWVPGTPQTSLERLPAASFENSREGLRQCLAWVREQLSAAGYDPARVALRTVAESTGNYALSLFLWLQEEDDSLRLAILNPQQTANYIRSRSVRIKDDLGDARCIARFGTERSPAPATPPSGAHAELRGILRQRLGFVEQRDATRNQLGALGEEAGRVQRRLLEKTIAFLDWTIEACEKEATRLLGKLPTQLARDVARLETMYGVGKLTALTIIAELGDLRRFSSPRQLACFCGLTPRKRESGEWKGQDRLSKFGNNYVRRILYINVVVLIRFKKEAIASWYCRKISEGKVRAKAHIGAMRKLLERMWYLVVRDLDYERFPQTQPARRSETCE